MRVVRRHPTSYEELLDLVLQAASGAQTVVMQAGHFLLYYDTVEDQLLPCVSTELHSPRHKNLREHAGGFPLESWRMGLDLLSALPAANKRVMIVVNDWQYLPPDVDRRRFYESFQRLPAGYEEALAQRGGAIQLLQPAKDSGTRPYFGEMNLRNQYKRWAERAAKNGKMTPGVSVEEIEGKLVCTIPDNLGREVEIYCSGNTGNCATAHAQLLRSLHDETRFDAFINLYPKVCREFIEQGTSFAQKLFNINNFSTINVGLQTNNIVDRIAMIEDCECSIHSN
jgi:hypothetical protein